MPKQQYYYDIESFPNYFCVTFVAVQTPKADINKFIKDDIRIYNKYDAMLDLTIVENRLQYEHDPELWASLYENIKPIVFEVYDDSLQIPDLITFIERNAGLLIGFNNSVYDDVLLDLIYVRFREGVEITAPLIYSWSNRIIGNQEFGNPRYSFGELSAIGSPYLSMDLMKLNYLDKNYISLKQSLIVLKWYKIQDYIVPDVTYEQFMKHYSYNIPAGKETEFYQRYIHLPSFHRYILKEFIPGVQLYNINDVLGLTVLHAASTKELKTRFFATTKYGIPILKSINASRSKLADLLLIKFYEDFTNTSYYQFRDKRTERSSILIGDCLKGISFTGNVPIKVYDIFRKTKGSKPQYKLISGIKNLRDFHFMLARREIFNTSQVEYVITINNTDYTIASGGLHSKDKPLVVKTTDDILYIDADVDSYYPRMVINNHIKPKHLTDAFVKIAEMITNERIEAKALQKTDSEMAGKAEVLKIVANAGFFGKFGAEGWLKDMLALVTVTFTGQLSLLMLVERLEYNGFTIASANTDGIIVRVPVKRKEIYDEICKDWQTTTGFTLSFTEIDTYIRRDVNHYSIKDKYGKFKYKGAEFNSELDLLKGYKHPIVPMAVEKYFFEGIPIKDTIINHKEILDFCISQKIGKQFVPEYHYMEEGAVKIKKLQHNIRYYIAKSGGILMKKYLTEDSRISLVKGRYCRVLNIVFDTEDITDYEIDYQYYIAEADAIFQSVYGQLNLDKASSKVKTGYLFD
jgi:hypothetical protein